MPAAQNAVFGEEVFVRGGARRGGARRGGARHGGARRGYLRCGAARASINSQSGTVSCILVSLGLFGSRP